MVAPRFSSPTQVRLTLCLALPTRVSVHGARPSGVLSVIGAFNIPECEPPHVWMPLPPRRAAPLRTDVLLLQDTASVLSLARLTLPPPLRTLCSSLF
eukprot:51497-Chlamydomonas_euryale.AAC.1